LRKAGCETGQGDRYNSDCAQRIDQPAGNSAQRLNSLRQEGGEGSIFHASQPASGGGSHQGLREIAGLDRDGDNSHSGGNQVDPDDKAECP